MKAQGYVHIYTGNGKGKTTASVGLALRALASGLKVGYIYLHKNPSKWGYGELNLLENNGAKVYGFAKDTPHFNKDVDESIMRSECEEALILIKRFFKENTIDLLVIDEIFISVYYKYLKEEDVLSLIKSKPNSLELVLTGRYAFDKAIEAADLVTEMKEIKHYYNKGVKSRTGIEC